VKLIEVCLLELGGTDEVEGLETVKNSKDVIGSCAALRLQVLAGEMLQEAQGRGWLWGPQGTAYQGIAAVRVDCGSTSGNACGSRTRRVPQQNSETLRRLSGYGVAEGLLFSVEGVGAQLEPDRFDAARLQSMAGHRGVRVHVPSVTDDWGRTVQKLVGHRDVRTTMLYVEAVTDAGLGIRSPLDREDPTGLDGSRPSRD
jgi:hypothetical protein